MHGWADEIAAAARGESKPENLLYIMFAHTEASQGKGMEFLGRFIKRQEIRRVRLRLQHVLVQFQLLRVPAALQPVAMPR